MRSSRGQYALETLLVMGVMIGFLGLLLTQGVMIANRMQALEQSYFERQFLDQAKNACRLLEVMGSKSRLIVEGFFPEKVMIQWRNDYLIVGDMNAYCPLFQNNKDENWQGHFEFVLEKS